MNKSFIFLLLLLSACASNKVNQSEVLKVSYAPVLKELEVFPGKVRKLAVDLPSPQTEANLECSGVVLPKHKENGQIVSFFALDYKHLENKKNKSIKCFLKYNLDGNQVYDHVFTLIPKKFEYPASYINVDQKHVDLSPADLKRYLKEKEELKIVYETAVKEKRFFSSEFRRPLDSEITGVYGSRRVFNNKKDSWHSGTDFRARTPTPIKSSNYGVVAYAGDLFFNGKTVFVDHGQGILTMYCHLSKINVKKGQEVNYDTILGLTGNTGRSSGPHLHWGVKINDFWIDGLQFLDEQKEQAKI